MSVPAIHFYDEHPSPLDFREEVLRGLRRPIKAISPKFFYDQRGSQLFDAICQLPEYYLTRTEVGLLRHHTESLCHHLGANCLLIELGSGSSHKVRLLLEGIRPAAYMPMDISKEHLLASAQSLAQSYPWLEVHAVCTDFSRDLSLPYSPQGSRSVAFFPGSSIGNFEPSAAQLFLQDIAGMLGPGGGLLIGVDLKKDATILNDAYNDSQGVTAEFNLNLLQRINSELGADFDLAGFRHHAFYNPDQGCVEMHLVSQARQVVTIGQERFHFDIEEHLHTESSHKYSIEEFQQLAAAVGFQSEAVWTDPEGLFSLHYLSC